MNRREVPARTYPDLHDHIAALEKAGQLIRVDRPINKDTEMHPLVRWQFRGGLPERERKAFLFTNVIDSKGKHYDIPVVVGRAGGQPRNLSHGAWLRARQDRGNLGSARPPPRSSRAS
jgi:4-hydroxy-3-polyprenylbenzoate decarboxylase